MPLINHYCITGKNYSFLNNLDLKIIVSGSISKDLSKFPDNWMALCWLCNIVKRRMVQGWKGEWETCPWAFPEKFDIILQVPISNETFEKLRKEGHTTETIAKTLGEYVERNLI